MSKQFIDTSDWRSWFAWYPIWVGNTLIWWEPVERRMVDWGYDFQWKYRLAVPHHVQGRD